MLHPSAHPPIHLSFSLFTCLSISPSIRICPSTYPFIHLSIHLPILLSMYPSNHSFIHSFSVIQTLI